MNLFDGSDLIVVGAGFYGLTVAERAARDGFRVTIIDKRGYLGGSANSYVDDRTGIEIHRHGPHVLHANNQETWGYITSFCAIYPYVQRTWTISQGKVWPLPVNLATICMAAGRHLTPEQARQWVESTAFRGIPSNLEEKALSTIGKPLYDILIKGYTKKQWGTDPHLLPPETVARMPVRYNYDNRYFSDQFEGLPWRGYHKMFAKMVLNPNIKFIPNCDWFEVREHVNGSLVVYTGAIDAYFNYLLGPLSWRVVDLQLEHLRVRDFQGIPVMYYSDESEPWTRITEFKHFRPDIDYGDQTVIAREYSRAANRNDVPHYPVNTPADRMLFDAYERMASIEKGVHFGGRLARYQYLDMHQAIGAALKAYKTKIRPALESWSYVLTGSS